MVTPPELVQYYSEKIVFFPETFQVPREYPVSTPRVRATCVPGSTR